MNKGLEALKEIIKVDEEALTLANKEKNKKRGDVMLHRHWLNQRKNVIEKELKALEIIKKCLYVSSSGAILLTDYGFEHREELKEVLL